MYKEHTHEFVIGVNGKKFKVCESCGLSQRGYRKHGFDNCSAFRRAHEQGAHKEIVDHRK
jgi:hypothetical protein